MYLLDLDRHPQLALHLLAVAQHQQSRFPDLPGSLDDTKACNSESGFCAVVGGALWLRALAAVQLNQQLMIKKKRRNIFIVKLSRRSWFFPAPQKWARTGVGARQAAGCRSSEGGQGDRAARQRAWLHFAACCSASERIRPWAGALVPSADCMGSG